jgi:hypothetical protein
MLIQLDLLVCCELFDTLDVVSLRGNSKIEFTSVICCLRFHCMLYGVKELFVQLMGALTI